MKARVAVVIGGTVLFSACHRQKDAISLPIPPPAQPRTVGAKQSPRRKQGAARKPVQATAAPQGAAQEGPKLVDYVTDEQRQQYDREIDASLRAAEENLTSFRSAGRADRQKEADRVESLIRQSRQERGSGDIATARKLATMAKVVSETLIR